MDTQRKELLKEWGFSPTPDPAVEYPMAPREATAKASISRRDNPPGGLERAKDRQEQGNLPEKPTHSLMECDSEDSVIMGPTTLLGKKKGKLVSTEEEDNAAMKGRHRKANRKARRVVSEKEKEEEKKGRIRA